MTNVTLEQAMRIIATALEKGRAAELKPLTVAVLDAGGHMVALQREDGSGILRVEIASAKAVADAKALSDKYQEFTDAKYGSPEWQRLGKELGIFDDEGTNEGTNNGSE